MHPPPSASRKNVSDLRFYSAPAHLRPPSFCIIFTEQSRRVSHRHYLLRRRKGTSGIARVNLTFLLGKMGWATVSGMRIARSGRRDCCHRRILYRHNGVFQSRGHIDFLFMIQTRASKYSLLEPSHAEPIRHRMGSDCVISTGAIF